MIPKGRYLAKALDADLGYSNAGNEQVAVMFSITQAGDFLGHTITWWGSFTEKACERTLETLRICGWQGDSLGDLTGIDSNEVEIEVDEEEGQDGKLRSRVKWVNRPRPKTVAMRNQMSPADKQAFAARMRGACIASRAATPATPTTPQPRPRSTVRRDDMDPDPSFRGAAAPAAEGDDIPF